MKCHCNCHNEQFRKDTKTSEHPDCGTCFIVLFEEAQAMNELFNSQFPNSELKKILTND